MSGGVQVAYLQYLRDDDSTTTEVFGGIERGEVTSQIGINGLI